MIRFYRSLIEVNSVAGAKLYCVVPSYSEEMVTFLADSKNQFTGLKKGDYFCAEVNIDAEDAKDLRIRNIEPVIKISENNPLDVFVKKCDDIRNHLRETISESRYLLWTPVNESNNTEFAVNYETWARMLGILYRIADWYWDEYNELIPLPDISNCDSTVDLWWSEKNFLMAINRDGTNNYYGKHNDKEVRGEINRETDYSFLSILSDASTHKQSNTH